MTVKEAASAFGVSTSTIYRWLRKGTGKVRGEKIKGRWHVWSGNERRAREREEQMDLTKWPVSNVTLAHPVGMPSDVALLGLCDIPADVPMSNRYDADGNKIPDPVGICLSMMRFRIFDVAGDVMLAEEAALPHDGKVRCVFGSKDLDGLWRVLPRVGAERLVYVEAYPRFYELDEQGHGHLNGDDRGYHRGPHDRSPVYKLSIGEGSQLLIDGVAMPSPEDPGPTAEEQADIDASDRQMREKREAHARREREIRERTYRENLEHNARVDRERAEQEEADRRNREAADARRQDEARARQREEERAAAERDRLGITSGGEVLDKLHAEPRREDSEYLSLVNLWSGQYDPDQDGFKARLVEIRQMDGMESAVDEVCRRLGWTL